MTSYRYFTRFYRMNPLLMASLLYLELPAIIAHLSREFAVFHLSPKSNRHALRAGGVFPSTMKVTSAIRLQRPYTTAISMCFANGQGLPFRWSSNSLRNFFTKPSTGIAAASPSGQKVRPSMFSARY